MIIMFVRHADAVNDEITDLGYKELEILKEYKENLKFSKVYTSSASRCRVTADCLVKKLDLPLEVCFNLKERELLREDEPKNAEECDWYDNYLNPNFSSKNPEGCKDFLERNFEVFDKIVKSHKDKNENIIIVAHSGTLYVLLAYIYGYNKNNNLPWRRVGNCSRIYFEV